MISEYRKVSSPFLSLPFALPVYLFGLSFSFFLGVIINSSCDTEEELRLRMFFFACSCRLGGRSFREEFGVGVSSVILEVLNRNGNDINYFLMGNRFFSLVSAGFSWNGNDT